MNRSLVSYVAVLPVTVAAQAGSLNDPFPAVLQLSSLKPANGGDGSLGFVIEGVADGDRIGQDVACAGDVNADGIDDIIVGTGIDCFFVRPFVVLGRNTANSGMFPAVLLPTNLGGTDGFRLTGLLDGEGYEGGVMVSGAGDVNADGVDDMIVGVPGAGTGNPIYPGRVHVLFGRNTLTTGAFAANVDISALNGTNGFIRHGFFGSHSGCSVAGAGDVNGDLVDDVFIGAESSSLPVTSFAGSSVFVYGSAAPFAAVASLTPHIGFYGIDSSDQSGCSVAGAGDVNHDGIADIVIGSTRANNSQGEAYVVFGRMAGFGPPSAFALSGLNGSNGFRLVGTGGCGIGVAPAGDLNHDGINDVAIASQQGAYVVFGRNTAVAGQYPSVVDLELLGGTDGFRIDGISVFGYYAGRVINGAGDVNADGVDDLVIGSMRASPGGRLAAGECIVVYGRNVASNGAFPALISPASLNGQNGFRLEGIAAGDWAGVSASSAGDINDDGVDDLLIGAVLASPGGRTRAGEAYVVFGRHAPALCAADANGDRVVNGLDLSVLLAQFGESVAPDSGADFNSDGVVSGADLSVLLGAFGLSC